MLIYKFFTNFSIFVVKSRVILDLFAIFHNFLPLFSKAHICDLLCILLIFIEFFTIFIKINCEVRGIGRDILRVPWMWIGGKMVGRGVKLCIFGEN
ncbi:hypothetical protein ABOONEI_803 [Aciduliprofundum boonei T469]|nr:hypothetical protein ABOONEI_803 [Aciduliprofundum boonei T469]